MNLCDILTEALDILNLNISKITTNWPHYNYAKYRKIKNKNVCLRLSKYE